MRPTITAMNVVIALLILAAPVAVAVTLGWAAHRGNVLRFDLAQFRVGVPLAGRFDTPDADAYRAAHDAEAIRSRFEQHPVWPSAGVLGERR
ncbi:hypothetical protein MSMEI_5926 [Mycolicibacterium smegmatis MC2 155]|uniref:Uncharacterized protein n=2 Tax=Mycolicibacterium smegmatis TaxID=1772 RepID=I7GG31_MYCS2|nr:hypothetical protein MSMEI_5926 [Mycolicibacterium smegmatis MC2 155]